jgi:hypothetical protein
MPNGAANKTPTLSENPIGRQAANFLLATPGCIDDRTNIACFTVFAR